jgi:calcineurin-like phosphoesterase family protein
LARSGIAGLALAGAIALGVPPPLAPPVAAASCDVEGVQRIVAVGDVHGAYDRYVELLKTAGVIDAQLRWSGGKTHLVQVGDMIDRGPDSRKVLDLLERLEEEAPRADGAVHVLLGNHEVMRMLGDFRYVTAGEYEAFAGKDSAQIKDEFLKRVDESVRAQVKDTPLGWLEMITAFRNDGPYGEWLRKHDVVAKINGILFVHGGIGPAVADMPCDAINATVRREITEDIDKSREAPLSTLSSGENGPLWYRGLAQENDAFDSTVNEILMKQGARAIVIGHTLTPQRRIQPRFGGKVIAIDTGMQPVYVANGRASALEIQDGVFTAVYTDGRDVLSVPAVQPAAVAAPR